MFGEKRDRSVLLDDITVTLSLDCLRQVGLEGVIGWKGTGEEAYREVWNIRDFTEIFILVLLSNRHFPSPSAKGILQGGIACK